MRTLVRCFLFVVFLFALLVGVGALANTLDPVYSTYVERVEQTLVERDNVEAVTVGFSHSRGIEFETLGLNGRHLWIPGCDYFEVEYFLRSITPELPALKYVFIATGRSAFARDNRLVKAAHDNHISFYYFAPTWRSFWPIPWDFEGLLQGKIAAVVRHDNWERFFANLGKWLAKEDYTAGGYIPMDATGNLHAPTFATFNPLMFKGADDKVVRLQFNHIQETLEHDPDTAKRSAEALVRSIRYLQGRGIRPIVYATPVTKDYVDVYREGLPGVTEEYESLIAAVCEQTESFFYDYSNAPAFRGGYAFFRDPDHLNTPGGKLFSSQFRLDLQLKSE